MCNRKTLTKEQRYQVYNKYNGRCAYCGCEIEYKDMQVDHLIPLCQSDNPDIDEKLWDMENLMPACRLCNHYKRSYTLEHFREAIEKIPFKLNRDSYIYRVGSKYGVVKSAEKKVIFLFEKMNMLNEMSIEDRLKYYSDNITSITSSPQTIGKIIKNYRKKAGLTQTQLADKAGLHLVTIKRYETDVSLPSPKAVINIALKLGCDPSYLLTILFDTKMKTLGRKTRGK